MSVELIHEAMRGFCPELSVPNEARIMVGQFTADHQELARQDALANLEWALCRAGSQVLSEYWPGNPYLVTVLNNMGQLVFGNWMAMVFFAGIKIKGTLKLHYRFQSANILFSHLGSSLENPRPEAVHDFMREFCSRHMGCLQEILAGAGIDSSFSMPVIMRGFDEVYLHQHGRDSYIESSWQIVGDCGSIIGTCSAECSDQETLKKLADLETKAFASAHQLSRTSA